MLKGMYYRLPHYVYLDKEKYKINTDFRIFINFEEEMQGSDKRKACYNALMMFYPAFFEIIEKNILEQAIDRFIWFYKCGKKEIQSTNRKKSNTNAQIFSYYYDDIYIWGTFNQLFHVDLTKDKIHWWKFRSMWLTLPNNCEFSKIKGYRAYNGKDKELLDLKELYRLPKSSSEIKDEIRRNKIYEALK